MVRRFAVSAEFDADTATFARDATSAAMKRFQLSRLGGAASEPVVLSDTVRDGWRTVVRAAWRTRTRARSFVRCVTD